MAGLSALGGSALTTLRLYGSAARLDTVRTKQGVAVVEAARRDVGGTGLELGTGAVLALADIQIDSRLLHGHDVIDQSPALLLGQADERGLLGRVGLLIDDDQGLAGCGLLQTQRVAG